MQLLLSDVEHMALLSASPLSRFTSLSLSPRFCYRPPPSLALPLSLSRLVSAIDLPPLSRFLCLSIVLSFSPRFTSFPVLNWQLLVRNARHLFRLDRGAA